MTDPTIKTATHASESGHWYSRDGQQILEVPRANGKGTRKATLADARKLDYAPGVTTIIGCAAKPQLTTWLQRQAILAALTLPRQPNESEPDWMRRVEIDMGEHARQAAEEGTRIHAAVQAAIQGQPVDAAYLDHVAGVQKLLPQDAGLWVAERCVVHPLGYGTKADISATNYLLDLKGKDGDQAAMDAMPTYDEHAMQLAATSEAIIATDKSGAREIHCGILFVSRTHPGAASLRWVDEQALMRGWAMFRSLLTYWQEKQGHRPWPPIDQREF